MKVQIEIECENVLQLQNTLLLIRDTINVRARFDDRCLFEVGTQFNASHPKWGKHEVTITTEQ